MKKLLLILLLIPNLSWAVSSGWYSTLQGNNSDVQSGNIPDGSTLQYSASAGQWQFSYATVPAGGSTGYVLTKNSGSNYDYSWQASGGGGGSQTPWTSNINGGGYSLSNVSAITTTGNVGIGTASPSDVLQVNASVGGETINYVGGSSSIVQSSSNANNFAVGNVGGTNYSAGQSIVFSTSVTISAISLTTTVASGSPAQITASIQTNSAGQPSGTLANANATKTFTPNNGTVTNISYTPFTIPAGTYWIVASANSGSNNWYDMNYNTTNPYSPGSLGQYNGATWSITSSEAIQFTVTAITSSGSPTLTFSNGGTTIAQIQATASNGNLLLINSGNVGIGTTSPSKLLCVGSTCQGSIDSSGNSLLSGTLGVTGHVTLEGVTSMGATGTGNLVFGTSPTLVTPALGTPSSVTLTNATGLPESGVTSLVASGKTFTANNSLTLAGTDGTTMTFPSTSDTVAGLGTSQTWTATQTLSAANLATDTTTGMKIGTSTTQKIGFFNSTPIVQPTGNICTAMTSLGLVASCTESGGGGSQTPWTGNVNGAGYSLYGMGAFYPSSDSTTAIQFNKANGTTNVLNIDTTNGRVGIGTTSPTAPLDIGGNITGNIIVGVSPVATISGNTNNITGVQMANTNSGNAADFRFFISDSGTSTGNYIAFSMPGQGNTGTLFGQTRSNIAAVFTNANGSNGRILALGTFINNDVLLGTNNTERMRISSSGNVGIGTSSPNYSLEINGSLGVEGHIQTHGTAPTLTSCGGSPSIVGNDNSFTITVGTTATGCTATFATAWTNAPSCTVTNQSTSITNAMTYTVSASAVVVSQSAGLSGDKLNVVCQGYY